MFAMIRDVARQTGCKMPKHVYLSPDVNACVFYNTSFWSIFFPVRKNLEIGLGLFDGTSVNEVKSVIAHEFGHFGQSSMKVGSTVYVTNTVLYNLIFTDDFWDEWLDKWCMSDTGIVRFFGVLTRALTNLVKRLTVHVYQFVQKGYLKLSRYMEYDADGVACRCVGTDTFISALCKIEVLGRKNSVYQQLLESLVNERKMISNVFAGKDTAFKCISTKDMPLLAFDRELRKPVRAFEVESRVKVENIWESHPALEDRIANARSVDVTSVPAHEPFSAWTLIPREISEKVSVSFLSLITKNVKETLTNVSDEQFAEWVSNEIKENFMEERLRPFFGNAIFERGFVFDLDYAADVPPEYPFTEENALKIAKFIALIKDWQLLNQVKNKEIKVKEVQLDGAVYERKAIPFEKLKMELDRVHEEVVKIYMDIYAYVRGRCDADKGELYQQAFAGLFYAQHVRDELLARLFAHRDALFHELNRATRRDQDEYRQLCSRVEDYEEHLKGVIGELKLDWIAGFIGDEEYIKKFEEYVNIDHTSPFEISTNAINEMFHVTEGLSNIQKMICGVAKRIICGVTLEVLDK